MAVPINHNWCYIAINVVFTDNSDQDRKDFIADFGSSETTDSIFSSFVNKICDTIQKEDFRKVRRSCVQNVNVTGGISLAQDTLDKIKKAENFDDLFDALCDTPYWNWMNIRMLEKMVGDCMPAKQLINQYKSEVYSRKLKDVLSEIPTLKIPTDKYTEVKVKWKKDFNELTVKDIVEQWNEIEKRFNVQESILLQSIIEGCVEICWLLPNDLVEHAISSVTTNHQVKCGDQSSTENPFSEVLYFKIGDVVMKDDIAGM